MMQCLGYIAIYIQESERAGDIELFPSFYARPSCYALESRRHLPLGIYAAVSGPFLESTVYSTYIQRERVVRTKALWDSLNIFPYTSAKEFHLRTRRFTDFVWKRLARTHRVTCTHALRGLYTENVVYRENVRPGLLADIFITFFFVFFELMVSR